MADRVQVRQIDDDEGRRLLRIIRRGTGSVVTWRRAQMVLLSAQGMPVARIAEVTFTSEDRVRDVIHNFNADGFDSLYPKYKGGRPRTFTLPERREIAKSKPAEHDLPFLTWSLTKMDEFGPLNLMPHPGRQWAEHGGKHKNPDREPRRRRRATYNRYGGVRHLFAALDLTRDKLYGHIKPTKRCQRVGTWAAANNVEIAYTPTNSSWLNRIEAQFTALCYFTLDGTDRASHKEQCSMIRRYIVWRNRHADDQRLRAVVGMANVA
ncbi:helix-turn-helix domain-containing protein [Streptomyces violascens]|uniref:helix-turn-helix domain-containing protein n=1 Tax=Streptomyces violascens TaxID=67381 RepID=UPI00364E39A1